MANTYLAISALALFAPLLALADSQDARSGPSAIDPASGTGEVNNAAGATGDSGSFYLSQGAIIAIIVVAVVVGIGGVASAVLFYIAKKRQWQIRKSIRRSARRLTGNFTAPRTPNPANRKSTRGATRIVDPKEQQQQQQTKAKKVPQFSARDLEKGGADDRKLTSSFDIEPPTPQPWSKSLPGFGKKFGR
ncbi:MAG: hypothetical protein M1825_005345 [Sarcosagium campestre]|nr:MAG: hypothetical protein M1825_005345 [Sarcosagium campestre]